MIAPLYFYSTTPCLKNRIRSGCTPDSVRDTPNRQHAENDGRLKITLAAIDFFKDFIVSDGDRDDCVGLQASDLSLSPTPVHPILAFLATELSRPAVLGNLTEALRMPSFVARARFQFRESAARAGFFAC